MVRREGGGSRREGGVITAFSPFACPADGVARGAVCRNGELNNDYKEDDGAFG